jgi:hypothetical protein
MRRIRELAAALLILLGIFMVARGIGWSVRQGLGWQGFVQSVVVGGLVFALGVARWRYWRQR